MKKFYLTDYDKIYIINAGGVNMKKNTQNNLKELFSNRGLLQEEKHRLLWEYYTCKISNFLSLRDSNMNEQLTIEIRKSFKTIDIESQLHYFILKNITKIRHNDLLYVFEQLEDDFEIRYYYMEKVFKCFEEAIEMKDSGKFRLPKSKDGLNEAKIDLYKEYLKGFNICALMDFLIATNMITAADLFAILKAMEQKSDNFIFPLTKIEDEESFLQNISQFTKYAVSNIDHTITSEEQETLSIFYQLLAQRFNPFSKEKIEPTNISLQLLESYHDEPFPNQIQKIKNYQK